MLDNMDTLDELGIEDVDLDAIDVDADAAPAEAETVDEVTVPAADATPVEPASTVTASPAPAVEPPALVMTLVFKGESFVTITAKRGDLSTVRTYATAGDRGVLLGCIEEAQERLAALEGTGVPDIKLPDLPKPAAPATKPAAKSAAKPVNKDRASNPAPEKPAPAAKAAPAPATKPVPSAPVETAKEVEARLFNKMVRLPDKRTGSVWDWADKEARTVEVLTNKGPEIFAVSDLTLIAKSK